MAQSVQNSFFLYFSLKSVLMLSHVDSLKSDGFKLGAKNFRSSLTLIFNFYVVESRKIDFWGLLRHLA